MGTVETIWSRINRYRRRLKDPKRAELEDYLPSQLAKFKFWAPIYDLFFRIQTVGRTQKVREAILKKVDVNGRILDVCCGTGTIAVALAQKFPRAEVYGLDISPHMLKRAKKKARRHRLKNVKFIEADARKIPFENDSFDVVINAFGLHEMPVRIMHGVMREMGRVLRKGGKLLLMDYQRPTALPIRLLFDFIMFFWEPRGTFLYCNDQGLMSCANNCRNGDDCFRGFGVDHFKTEKCWRTSAVICAAKEEILAKRRR